MNYVSKEILEHLRKEYPVGARVELVKMDDAYNQAPPIGTHGTVRFVDDSGAIHVGWDTGGSLSVIYGEDECRVVEK